MKKLYFAFLMWLMLFMSLSMAVTAAPQQPGALVKPQVKEYEEGKALVLLDGKNVSTYQKERSLSNSLADVTIEHTWNFNAEPSAGTSVLTSRKDDLDITVLLVSSDLYSTEDLVKLLQDLPSVKYAEPNYRCYATALSTDTYTNYQWALENTGQNDGSEEIDINVDAIWQTGKKGTDRVIAVLDTGINYSHEDLKNNMWRNPYGKALSGLYGYDFINGDDDPMDDYGHGTHCAGIIAAQGNNAMGITGINQSAKLMALKFLDAYGDGYLDAAINAYNYIYKAQALGVNVVAVNNSWGSEGSSNIFAGVINKVGEKGAVSVCAAGNSGINTDISPEIPGCTDSPYVINVAALREDGDLASFSNYGSKSVDIAAPGTNILSTVIDDTFNPTIYQNKDELCANFYDFSNPSSFAEDYKFTNEKGNVTTEITSDNYFGLKNSNSKALTWNINNAKANDIYHLYFPFVSGESSKSVYMSAMAKIASAPFSNNWYYYGCVVTLSYTELESDGTLPEDYNPEETTLTSEATDYDLDYWSHLSGPVEEKLTAGKNYALVLSLYTNKSGNYAICLDDVAVSKENVDSSAFGKYEFYSGTSMAAPMVTGAAALLSSVKPGYNAGRLCATLKNMTRNSNYLTNKIDSGGILDLSMYGIEKPYLNSAKINGDGTVTISGYSFGSTKGTVRANGLEIASSSIQWKDTEIKVPGSNLINKVVTFEVTNNISTVNDTFYIVDGKKSFTKIPEDLYWYDGGKLTTDGESFYYVDESGTLWQNQEDYWMPVEEMYIEKMFPKASVDELYSGTFYFDSELVYLNGSFYGIGVLDSGYSKDSSFIRYDLTKGEWVRVGNTPSDGEFSSLIHSTLAVYNGKLYLLGGLNAGTYEPSKAVRIFDPEKYSWSVGSSLPEARFHAIGRQVGDSLVLVLGGNSSGTSPKAMVYRNGAWTTGGAITSPLNYSAYMTRSDGGNGIPIIDEYTGKTDYFREVKYYQAPVGVTSEGLIITGLPSNSLGDTYIYNLASKSFKATNYQLSTKTTGYDTAGIAVGNKFYVIRGIISDLTYEGDYTLYESMDLMSIPVNSGLLSVSAGTVKNGKVSGAGLHLPGQTVQIKAVPSKGYYLNKFTVDGKVIKGSNAAIVLNKNVKVTATFSSYKTKVTLNHTKTALASGKTRKLKAKVNKSANGSKTVTWTSSNTKYATVNKKGKVTVKKAGIGKTVTITATATDGSKAKAKCKVSIYKKIKKINLSANKSSLKAGKTLQITAKLKPKKGVLKTLKWKSSNSKYAVVNKQGKVTAKKAGIGKNVTITATATDGSKMKGIYVIRIKK